MIKGIADKPWEYQQPDGATGPETAFGAAAEKVALTLFLVVVCVIFSLLAVTYYLRMDLGDWVPLADPSVLWVNTAVLVASSVLFQLARNRVQIAENGAVRNLFLGGGVLAILFVCGQLYAWQQLEADGLGVRANAASSFFYLLTGVHAAHLVGGLWVWSKTAFRLFRQEEMGEARLSIELCTTYWHFLLVLWVLLFAVLANT